MTRREFLKLIAKSAGAGVLLSGSGRVFAQPRTSAELIFVGGKVVTMNPAQSTAEAVAVGAGRIMAVGSREEIAALRGARTTVVDLAGQCLSPGLIDAHSHLGAYGQMELHFVKIRQPQVHNYDTLCEALAAAAKERQPGEWIMARGFGDFDEGRFPTRTILDEATPRNPVLCVHWTGQYGIANSLALQQANILRADVEDPYGGKFLRDRDGMPDGMLLHYPAIYAVYQPSMTPVEQREAVIWAAQEFVNLGVTCVHDNFCTAPFARQYAQLDQQRALPLRVRVYPYVANVEQCRRTLTMLPRYRGAMVRLQGIKFAVDGYPLMYRVPPQQERLNIPMHPPEAFQALATMVHQAGLQADVHAAGDRGVDMTLDAFSQAAGGDAKVREMRHRIEHAMFRNFATINRAADMGVPICTQPFWLDFRAIELLKRLRREDVVSMVPCASFLRGGVQLCFGADVPASPSLAPLDSMVPAMTRRTSAGVTLDPSERISFMQALNAQTLAAAYAAHDETDLGSIEVGKCADFAIWNRDLETINAANAEGLAATGTYVGGVKVA